MSLSFTIDKRIFGTKKHFVRNQQRYSWVDEINNNLLWLDGNIKLQYDHCFDTVLKLNHVNIDKNPPQRFVKAMKSLNYEGDVPWSYVLPKKIHNTFMKTIVNKIDDAQQDISSDYYDSYWIKESNVFRSFKKAKIDIENWNALIAANVGNKSVIETFKPIQGGYAPLPKYNRFGTRTGRLTVSSGPSILTLKKEYRSMLLRSRWGTNGRIVYVDFASLEPRIALYEAGHKCNDPDLYQFVNRKLFNMAAHRNVIKEAIISQLYGISKSSLKKKLNLSSQEVSFFINHIKRFFKTKTLLTNIKNSAKNNRITNKFGRIIDIDVPMNHIYVNSYVQSTGVDVALLGFNELLSRLSSKVVPLYVITDALICDVHVSELENVYRNEKITIPGYGDMPFFLTFEEFSCTTV